MSTFLRSSVMSFAPVCHHVLVFFQVGNILVVIIIIKDKELRKNTSNLYLLSLVTARASVGE